MMMIKRQRLTLLLVLQALLAWQGHNGERYSYANKPIEDDLAESDNPEAGKLPGDVQNWAAIIQNYIIQLANDNINRDLTQELFDLANYTVEAKSAYDVIKDVKSVLSDYFVKKQEAASVRYRSIDFG